MKYAFETANRLIFKGGNNKMTETNEVRCFHELSNAIVLNAVEDYRKCIRNKTGYIGKRSTKSIKAECIEFFKSSWFQC